MRALAFVCVAACGRIAFDPTGDSATGGTCVPEVCNGVDDNCNDSVDEECPCTAFVTQTPIEQFAPYNHPVWTGEGYFFVRYVGGLFSIMHSDDLGTLTPLPLVFSAQPRLGWTGDRLLAAFENTGMVTLMTFTLDGATDKVTTIGQGTDPFISRAGVDFDIAWTEMSTERRFWVQRVDRNGNLLGAARRLIVPTTLNLVGIATSRTVALAGRIPPSHSTANAFDTTAPILDDLQAFYVALAGDTVGFEAVIVTTSSLVARHHADPDGIHLAGPIAVATGTLAPTFVAAATRGNGRYVVVVTGSDATQSVGRRYDVDGTGTLSEAEMLRVVIGGGATIVGPPGSYADLERTALVFSYQDFPNGQLWLAQRCP